jgi:hypothetical protein
MTCKRIAKLLSEQQDHELSFSRRLAIHIHLFWCVFCRRLARHLEILRGVSRIAGGVPMAEDTEALGVALPADAKARMREMLAQNNR